MKRKNIVIILILIALIIQPTNTFAKSTVDIVFIIDRSGSMGGDINNVRYEINSFTNKLENQGLDYRLGLVTYEDDVKIESMTNDVDTFKDYLRRVNVSGGTENGLDAIMKAISGYTYRENALKYFVLIGDERITSDDGYTVGDVISKLKSEDIIVTTVSSLSNHYNFVTFPDNTGGLDLNLNADFGANLEDIFDQIQAIPMIDIIMPTEGQILSDTNGVFIPQIKVSDPDSDTLTLNYFLDTNTTSLGKQIITNTETEHIVNFGPFDFSSISEGNHTLRFTAYDGQDTAQDVVSIKVDTNAPAITSFNVISTDTSISIAGGAIDNVSGLHTYPYRFIVGDNPSWTSNSSYTKNSLTPNTQYGVRLEVRDSVGHVSSQSKSIYTKAQTPKIKLDSIGVNSFNITTEDKNPLSTEYQIRVGNQYVSQNGELTSSPVWITLKNKSINVTGLSSNTTYSIDAKARNQDGTQTSYSSQIRKTTLADFPKDLDFQVERNSITISWSGVSNISGYDIEVDGRTVYNGTSTTYIHEGLTPDSQHNYRVRAKNQGGDGPWSPLETKTTLPNPPKTPSNINIIPEQIRLTITWDSVIYAEKYFVEVDGQIIDNDFNILYIHEDLKPETTHNYRIKASNRGGDSEWSEVVTETTYPFPPEVPTNIITEITKDSVTLSWDSMDRATGYELEVDGLIVDNQNNTTYLHSGLEPLSGHTYRVKAKNRGGKSAWSEKIDVTTHPEKPVIPNNIMATSEENSISINWYKVPDAETYDIEIDGQLINDISVTRYIHNGLNPDSKHVYRVRAKNITGISEWSKPVTMFTLPVYQNDNPNMNIAMTNIAAVVTNNKITLSWDAMGPDVQYEIEVDGSPKDIGEDTIFNHSGLEPNSFHSYKIRFKTSEGVSNWCGVLSLTTLPDLPDSPSNIEAYATDNFIELRWKRMEGAEGYDIEIDGNTVETTTDNKYVDADLEPGTSHIYRVRAKNITGVTSWSVSVNKSTTNPTYTIQCFQGQVFDLSLLGSNIQDFNELKFVVTYNPDELEVIDLYNFTTETDLMSEGEIPNSNISVTYQLGRIEFTIDKNIVPGTSWAGEISSLLFKSKVSGEVQINFVVE